MSDASFPRACAHCGSLPAHGSNGVAYTISCPECYDGAPDSLGHWAMVSELTREKAIARWNDELAIPMWMHCRLNRLNSLQRCWSELHAALGIKPNGLAGILGAIEGERDRLAMIEKAARKVLESEETIDVGATGVATVVSDAAIDALVRALEGGGDDS